MIRLQQIRSAKGISKRHLARQTGIALSYIHDIESGNKSPTVRTLEKLASALGVTVAELLGEDKPTGTEGGGEQYGNLSTNAETLRRSTL